MKTLLIVLATLALIGLGAMHLHDRTPKPTLHVLPTSTAPSTSDQQPPQWIGQR